MKRVFLFVLAIAVMATASSFHRPMEQEAVTVPLSAPLSAPMAESAEETGLSESWSEPTPEPTQVPTPTPEPTPDPNAVDPNKPMLALTFDDGPGSYTDRLLDIFEEHGGKGTFFLLGCNIPGWEDTVARMAEDGHEVANHSWNHPELTTLDYQGITHEIADTRSKIYDVTGVNSTLVRPPYGSVDEKVTAVAAGEGVALIKWNVDTMDWDLLNADAVYEVIMEQAADGAIILCHDVHKTTVDAMERAIPDLIAEGYQLVSITELLTCNGETIEAGAVYHSQDYWY